MTKDPYEFLPVSRQSQPRTKLTVAIAITMTAGALVWAMAETTAVGLLPAMMKPVVWTLVIAVAIEIPFTLSAPYSDLKIYLEKAQKGLLYAIPLVTIGILLGAVSLSAVRSPLSLIASYPALILGPLLVAPILTLSWKWQASSVTAHQSASNTGQQ